MDNILGLTNITNYIWVIPLVFSIHEFEEWNILKWYKKHYMNLPRSTDTSIHIHIIVLSILSFLLILIAYIASGTFLFSYDYSVHIILYFSKFPPAYNLDNTIKNIFSRIGNGVALHSFHFVC